MNAYEKAGQAIADKLKEELEAQGHVATGTGLASIVPNIIKTQDGARIQVLGVEYLLRVNDGVLVNDLPSVEQLKGDLWEWIQVKGIPEEAFYPILQAILNEGIPTSGSYVHSENGRRKNFINHVIENEVPSIKEELLQETSLQFADELINSIVGKAA